MNVIIKIYLYDDETFRYQILHFSQWLYHYMQLTIVDFDSLSFMSVV